MFDNIVGNEKIKKELTNTVLNKKTSHSYIFSGLEGIGKKLIAKEFSKMLLCLDENNKYCDKCKSCIEFNSNNNPDFNCIEPEGNVIKINQIRQMQTKVQEKPIISKNKIYIINDADKMTQEAQNCLLKTLEEPPEFVTIILIGQNDNAFLSTIKSRCMILHFEAINNEDMKHFLSEKYKTENLTQTELEMFQGSILKAINMKDKSETYEKVKYLIEYIRNNDLIDSIDNAEIIYQSKDEIQNILGYMNTIFLKLSRVNHQYANCISIVEDTKQRLKQNSNYDMCIDNMLFNIWREVN